MHNEESLQTDHSPAQRHAYCLGMALLSAAALPPLVDYESASPVLLGRYSLPYFALLVAVAAAAIAFLALGWSRSLRRKLSLEALESAVGNLCGSRILLLGGILSVWIAAFFCLWTVRSGAIGKSAWLHLVALLVAFWTSLWLLVIARPTPRSRVRALAKFNVLLGCLSALVVLVELTLRSNPGLLAAGILESLPEKGDSFFSVFEFDDEEIGVGYRYKPNKRFSQELWMSATYAYDTYRGVARSLPPGEDQLLTRASFTTDELGYRNTSPLLAEYPIVVSGDSFTSHSVEPSPWASRLAEDLQTPVLNLGLQGYGPQNEVEAILRYGLPRKPRHVIVAYYEGNDLLDAEGYEDRRLSGLGWRESIHSRIPVLEQQLCIHLASYVLRKAIGEKDDAPGTAVPVAGEPPYPFEANFEGKTVELGFADTYLSLLALPRDEVKKLRGYDLTRQAYRRLAEACSAQGAHLTVLYVPTKEHVYIPLLPGDLVARKLGKAVAPALSPEGDFLFERGETSPLQARQLLENLDAQRQVMLEAFAELKLDVIDLTPELQVEARKGEPIYWSLDNHWRPAGHAAAARALGRHLGRG